MLIFWHGKQEMCYKWVQAKSEYFTICNGVRQGGILSPRLFAVYKKNKNKFISENMTMIITYGMKITVIITPGNPYYGDYR